jgi:hypothetical protein
MHNRKDLSIRVSDIHSVVWDTFLYLGLRWKFLGEFNFGAY